jgi:hypothetical protein
MALPSRRIYSGPAVPPYGDVSEVLAKRTGTFYDAGWYGVPDLLMGATISGVTISGSTITASTIDDGEY